MRETFAQILLELRDQADISQKELAERSHVSVSQISRLERDDTIKKAPTVISYHILEALANGLGLAEDSPDRRQFFEAAAERNRQKRAEKSGIAPSMAPILYKKPGDDVYSNGGVDLTQMRVITRMEEVADCAISMLAKASKEKLAKGRAEEIRVTTLGDSSIFRRLKQEDRWNQAIRSVMRDSKCNVVNLYMMNDDPKRTIEVIEDVRNLSLYPSRFNARYFRRGGEIRPCYNLLIIKLVGALWCLSTNDPAVVDSAFFYPDTPDFKQHISLLTDHFNLMYTETTQLARTYERRSAEWEDTMTRVCQLEADEFLANNSIDTNSMPYDLYNEYLKKSLKRERPDLDMEFRDLKTHHSHRREAFEHHVRSFMYRTIMPWRSFEDALGLSENAEGEFRYLAPYASGPDQYITVNKSLAIKHIKHLIDDLERYENYEIALVDDHPSVEDLLYTPWLVKGEAAVLTAIFTKSDDGEYPVFAAEFELSETSIVSLYRKKFLTLWGEVADQDKAKQKANVIGKLIKLLEKAEGNL